MEEIKRDVNKVIWRGVANTKVHLKGHMETYCSRNLLKYIHIKKNYKWSHQMPTVDVKQSLAFSW